MHIFPLLKYTHICSEDDAIRQVLAFHKVTKTMLDSVEHGVDQSEDAKRKHQPKRCRQEMRFKNKKGMNIKFFLRFD